jgi:hypothetical protein
VDPSGDVLAYGVTVSTTPFVTPPYEAEIVTALVLLTGVVRTMKVADDTPAGMVTFAGTEATLGVLLLSVTTAPPAFAGAVSLTVPSERQPPRTSVGFSVSDDSFTLVDGRIVSVADRV